MTGVTFVEFLEMARRIENGSVHFYRRAAKLLKDEESIRLADTLAVEEEGHLKKIAELQKTMDDRGASAEGIRLDMDSQGPPFSSPDITECASPEEILETAIRREKETERLYENFLSTENLPDRWEKLFAYLKDQERAHSRRLGAILYRDEN